MEKPDMLDMHILESPGNGYNGIDDNEDGMVDEKEEMIIIDNDGDWKPFTGFKW